MEKMPLPDLQIEPYTPVYQKAFKELNLFWLDKYHLTEAPDLEVLNNPGEIILNRGGFIWLALAGGVVIGSAALVKADDDIYELAKMAVAPEWQGKGIARKLIVRCLAKASECKARKIVLYSNHQLTAALHLYEQFGFTYVPLHHSPFQTADIMMERLM